ncbi:unnamed protein product [Tilletia controversa]|nr:hypothetical protein CF336_g4607 [Tilletia laevis]KAE8261175.1 hypothetical protein A4X03_0g3480 [Tilletia caries]CAD6897354.1 unnamed protein product [Tilletia controversa]CAD6884018.1 unnamed protein product [Tilletia caries]CAD6902803.1 unnamed protein product [Tilletia controversa]
MKLVFIIPTLLYTSTMCSAQFANRRRYGRAPEMLMRYGDRVDYPGGLPDAADSRRPWAAWTSRASRASFPEMETAHGSIGHLISTAHSKSSAVDPTRLLLLSGIERF